MYNKEKDANFVIMSILAFAIILSIPFNIWLMLDNRSSHSANTNLKEENYKLRNEVKKLRESNNKAQSDADKWYNNYIDLGNQCGANE